MINWMLWSLLMILGMKSTGGALRANQDHVCLKNKEYTTTIWVDETVPQLTIEKSWCWDPAKGFRCTRVKVKNQTRKTPKEIVRTRLVLKCCDGYEEIFSKCISKCSTECFHHGCLDENLCKSGDDGPPSHEFCPRGKWGINCLKNCNCANSNGCDPVDGRCSCLSGWKGLRCQSPCPPGHYGMNCQSKCNCHNSACHHVTGACLDPVTEIILNKLKAPDSLSEPAITEVSAPEIPPTEISSTSTTKATTIPLIIKTEDLEMSQTNMETTTVILLLPSDSSTNTDTTAGENPTKNFINEREEEISTTDLIGDEETTLYGHVSWEATESTEEETFVTDNSEIYSSSHKLGTPEIETIGEKKNYVIGPTTREPSLTTVETTFTGGTQSATKNNFGHTKINSYNNVTDNGNEVVNTTTTTSDGSKSADNNDNIINISWTGESSSIASTDIQPVKGETSTKPPEKGTEETFRHFNTFRFIPSLSVLTGITILILIIGARWLALQHKRKNNKILARKKQEIFKSKERQKFRESLFIEKSFLDASVCLYEMNSKEERPTLQTFKPLPGS